MSKGLIAIKLTNVNALPGLGAVRVEHAPRAGRVGGQLVGRANWPGHKMAAAVGANAVQHGIDTRRAKRALKRADARLRRIWRQVHIATFARGAEFKH